MNAQTAKKVLWIGNIVVALLCIVAIAGYFFAPFWRVGMTYALDREQLTQILGRDADASVLDELMGGEGVRVSLSFEVETPQLFAAFSSNAQTVAEDLIGKNADRLAAQLTAMVEQFLPTAVKLVVRQAVWESVNSGIYDYLADLDPKYAGLSSEQVEQKLKDATGIDSAYFFQQTDRIVDAVFDSDGATVENVTDEMMEIVDDVYGELATGSDAAFRDLELTEEKRETLRDAVGNSLSGMTDGDGRIDLDIDGLLADLLASRSSADTDADADGVQLLSAAPDNASSDLSREVKDLILDYLPEGAARAVANVLRGMCVLFLLSSAAWIYILVKLVVKLSKRGDPAVRLKMPVLLGWLPFLFLVCIPSVGIGLVSFAASAFDLGVLRISFFSSGFVAFAAACAVFALSIFYMVMRKKLRAPDLPTPPQA